MLSKLLKHEFRATGRIMLPVFLMLLTSAGLFNLFLRLSGQYDYPALSVLQGLFSTIFFITLIGTAVASFILMIYRFYKNYMKDEGYLMFTLPVTTGQLIWSKLIVALVWSVATILVILGSVALALLGQPFWREVTPYLNQAWQFITTQVSSGNLAGFIVEFILYIILAPLASYLMIYASIALGHTSSNHKILLSVIIYFGLNTAIQTVTSFGSVFGILAISEGKLADFVPKDPISFIHTVVISTLILALIECALFYLITHSTLKKRLNLQ